MNTRKQFADGEEIAEVRAIVGRKLHDDLRRLAYEQRVSMSAIVEEGLRIAIAARNQAAEASAKVA